jgi:hypothetical protein
MGCKIDISNLPDVSIYLAGDDRRFNHDKGAGAVSRALVVAYRDTFAGAKRD